MTDPRLRNPPLDAELPIAAMRAATIEYNSSLEGKHFGATERIIRAYLSALPLPLEEQPESLDERMKAAGMFTVAEMMGVTPMTRWEVHTGIRDLDTFGQWLDRKVSEYLRMKACYELGDKDKSDDLYEWVLAHAGAYSTIRTNFKAALERSAAPSSTSGGGE